MPHVFTIRTAGPGDAAAIARHRAEMFSDMGHLPPAQYPGLVSETVEYLTAAIPAGEYIGWLVSVEEQTAVIAGAGVQIRRILPRPIADGGSVRIAHGREGIVLNVFTEKPWRRKGLANLLMERVLEWAPHAGLDRLVLHASEAGRPLYDRLGFVLTNEMRYARPLR